MTDTMTALPLTNRVVAIPESRQLDLLADMLEKRGATVVRCPLVAILDAPDPEPISAWLKAFIAEPCDIIIFLTGEGLRRLVSFAERAQLKDEFITALGAVKKITRGPKPGRALKEIALKTDLLGASPTTDGIIETLDQEVLKNKRIAVQLYGNEPNEKLMTYLKNREAIAFPVAPYIYAPNADEEGVLSLIEQLEAGDIDVMTFTSKAQYKRLVAVAKKYDKSQNLQQALINTKVAAIGPVVKEQLCEAGISVDMMPETSFFMKPLVRKIVEVLAPEHLLASN